jgi:NAD(P)-dependent dehydrogenase (short-subunit alcohol dehydrogenase family)
MDARDWFERGHVAIVTGASKGLGRAVARRLAERGLRLVIDARGEETLREAEAELSALTEVVALAGDVAEAAHVHALVQAAADRFGRIDLVVNNASSIGGSPMPPLERLSPAKFEQLFTTNAYAPLHLIQHALPLLRASRGTIVNITSDAAVEAYEGWGGYGASKAALEHLSRVLAAEIGDAGVRVIVADPGNMDTELHRAAEPGVDLSDLPSAEDVAPALLAAIASADAPLVRVELQRMPASAAAEVPA